MKKICLILILAISPHMLFSSNTLPPVTDRMFKILSDLKGFFPRHEGSRGEKELIAYIEKTVSDLKITYTKLNFNSSDSFHSFSENIQVQLPGEKKDSIIFLIPLNHPPAANADDDGLINIALALTYISHYANQPLPLTLQFVFLGAEYGDEEHYPLGTSLFLNSFFPDYPVMLLYLGFTSIPKSVTVNGAGNGRIAPYWLIIRCLQSLKKAGVPFTLSGNRNQVFRLGLAQRKTRIEPYLMARYPALSLTGVYGNLTVKEKTGWMFSFNAFIDNLLNSSKGEIPEYWDQHYLFFQFQDYYLFITEMSLLIIFCVVIGLALLFMVIFHQNLKNHIRSFFRHLWAVPLIIAIAFLLLILSTLILNGILQLKKDASFWSAYPFLFLLLKVFPITLIFVLGLKVLHYIPFPMTRSYYSALAIILFLVDIFMIAFINISFVYYYLWAFFFTFIAFIFRNRIIRLFILLPAPYWIVKMILDFFIFIPEPKFCQPVLFSFIKGNIVISLLLLPFICLFINIFLYFFPARHKRSKIPYNMSVFFLLIINISLFLLAFYLPHFSAQKPQEIKAANIIDYEKKTHSIEIKSEAPLGSLTVLNNEAEFQFNTTSSKYIIPDESMPELLLVTTTQKTFLDRNNVVISLKAEGFPSKVHFTVNAKSEFTLYDANFPFKRKKQGETYEILIGAYPPSPLRIELTLPKHLEYEFDVSVDYIDFPFSFAVSGENKTVTSVLSLRKKIAWR